MSVQQEAFRVAVTGGTGFVGRTTIAQACALGLPLNALARQPQAACAGVTWVNGALDRDDCLQRLMADADVEIGRAHVELQSLMRISYAVFCLKKKKTPRI